MRSGLAGSITIVWSLPDPLLVTFCCWLVLRLPAAAALARRRWMEAATSDCWPIIASPIFCVQSSWLFIMARVWGKAVSDFTLTSQFWFFTAATAALPFRLGLACDHRAASTTSIG